MKNGQMLKMSMTAVYLLMTCLFSACSDDNKPDPCSTAEKNSFLYMGVMTNTYYWYDKVPVVDWSSYPSPQELLADLVYDEIDRWSYITSTTEHSNLLKEGKYLGLGFMRKCDDDDRCYISTVFKDSPTDLAGIERGDEILEINGTTMQEIESQNLWNTIFGPDEKGVEVTMKIAHRDQSTDEYTLEKTWIIINTVLHYEVIQSNDKKIGYLVFTRFFETSVSELDAAFTDLKEQEIEELILDLRYNGGGLVSVANQLASLISGANTEDETFVEFIHNDKYPDWNGKLPFESLENALDLTKLVVITSSSTASASELIINSLRPFLEVATIGETTRGKPVGMRSREFCGMSVNAIEFELVNANGDGGYFDGIEANCLSGDDLTRALGDPQEASLQEALYYIEHGSCSESYASTNNQHYKPTSLSGFRLAIGAF